MTKLRKQRRRKTFRYNVNRKRLRNKVTSVGKIGCKEIADEWERHKSMQTNLKEMGLSSDPNQTIKITNPKILKPSISVPQEENKWMIVDEPVVKLQKVPQSKKIVAKKLLDDAKAPRVKMLRLPGSLIEWVTYLLDTYGKDYRAMARDKKNRDQETWKQIRQKIRLFKSIPEHYNEYLRTRGKVDDSGDTSSDGEL